MQVQVASTPSLCVTGVCVHVCSHVHNHICMCRSEDNLGCRSQVPHTLLFETDLSLGLVPTNVLEWLATNPQEIYPGDLPFSALGFPAGVIVPGFPSHSWESNSCTYAHKANTSAPASSPQPTTSFLNPYSGLTFQGHTELFSNVPKTFPKINVTCSQITVKSGLQQPTMWTIQGTVPSS